MSVEESKKVKGSVAILVFLAHESFLGVMVVNMKNNVSLCIFADFLPFCFNFEGLPWPSHKNEDIELLLGIATNNLIKVWRIFYQKIVLELSSPSLRSPYIMCNFYFPI